jgi:hypothetical protein
VLELLCTSGSPRPTQRQRLVVVLGLGHVEVNALGVNSLQVLLLRFHDAAALLSLHDVLQCGINTTILCAGRLALCVTQAWMALNE